MDIAKKIAEELEIKVTQVEAAVKLIDEGCTIPFIARYRKEVTGALNDEQLRNLDERLKYLRNLEDRKTQVLASIEEQGKLTEELKAAITAAETMVLVEDLYRPYKQKRRTRATIAKEKGLEPLAQFIYAQEATEDVEVKAAEFISDEEGSCYSTGCNSRCIRYNCRTDIRCCRLQNIYQRHHNERRKACCNSQR